MKKAGGKPLELKIGKLFFITFIFFLLVTTPTEKQSPVDEPSQIDDASPVNSSPEAERITYAPEVSHRGGKALYSLGDYDYQKRIQINVTNNANEALSTGYSVSFSLNTWYLTNQGELQADGDDLRIAYNDSGSWVEKNRVNVTAFNTYKTQIWFKTEKPIAANNYDANYWIYYANPSVSDPPKDPAQVFLFFEDFNDGNYLGWNISSGSWTVSEYPASSGNYVVHGANAAYLYKDPELFGNVSISARIRWEGGDRRRGVSTRFDQNGLYSYRLRMESSENGIELRRLASSSSDLNTTTAFPSGVNYDAGNWYRYEIAAQTVGWNEVFVHGRIYDANMTLRMELSAQDDSFYALDADGKIALYGEGWFDDVIVRRFIKTEPTVELISPRGIHLMLLTQDSTTASTETQTNVPFYNHLVQELGYVVDYHGLENKESADAPFYVEDYDGVLISAAVVNGSWTANLGDAAIPVLTWESGSDNELYMGEVGFTTEETLRPNGRGYEEELDSHGSGGSENWQYVNDTSPDGDASYVERGSSSWRTDTYLMENHLVGNGSIENVTIFIVCKEWVSAYAKTVIRTYSTNYEGVQISLTGSYIEYSTVYPINPSTGAAWTWQEIDDLEIGVIVRRSGDWGEGWCTQVYTIVKYSPDIAYTLPVPTPAINITDNTHFITSEQALGQVDIYSAPATMGYMLNFTQLPSGSGLAKSIDGIASRGQLIAFEKGAVDYYPPHTAPERRVFWPGQDGSALNTEGWALFDRALHWALHWEAVLGPPYDLQGGYMVLPSEDGLLKFYFTAKDDFPGLNTSSGLVNITAGDPVGPSVYSLPFNGTHFTGEVQLPYWEGGINNGDDEIGKTQNRFSYNFTVSDLKGLSNTTIGGTNQPVPDVTPPSLGDSGVVYAGVSDTYTIWSSASDGFNGSGIDYTPPPDVGVNISYYLNNPPYIPAFMIWSNSRWENNVTVTTGQVLAYYINATDRVNNFNESSATPRFFNPLDSAPPVIQDYNHIHYGNTTVHFWANVTDALTNVTLVELEYNSTTNPIPQTVNMEYNGTLWVKDIDFPWNLTYSPEIINYTIARARDENGNESPSAAYKGLVANDLDPPVITAADFEAVPDKNGHLRFWANISDAYSGLNSSRIFINITLSNGTSFNNSMIYNGTFYTNDTYDIAYWEITNVTRMSVSYNVTAFDNADLFAIPSVGGKVVPDVVPPTLDTGIQDYLNGTVAIWANTSDGIGSGLQNVSLDYRKIPDPSTTVDMSWNGSVYTHNIGGLQAGNLLEYNVTSVDNATNSKARLFNLYGIGYQTPPIIHEANKEYVPTTDGRIRFYANVTEDIGGVKTVVVDGTVAGSPFNGIMTDNGTFYTYEMNAYYGKLVSYNVTASNYAGLTNQTTPNNFTVQDIVAPQTFSFQVTNNQDGTIVFRATVSDGQFGSGIDSSKVILIHQSYGSNWVTKSMWWDGTNYVYTLGNVFIGDVIKYYVGATDNAGKYGQSGLNTFPVIDYTSPIINEIGYDYLNDTDGHIRFWCYANDPFGILRTTNIKITGDQDEDGVMLWIGAYYYYDTYLLYENNFNFTVTVRDTAGNTATMSEFNHQVQDTVSPQTISAGGEEFQNGTAILWVLVEDGAFGSGFPPENNTVNITYRIPAKLFETTLMTWNSETNRYEHAFNGLIVGDAIDFAIDASDKAGNLGQSRAYTFIVPDTTPPQITAFGYSLLPQEEGLVQFWASAEDSFGTIENVNLTINIISETSSTGKSASASKSVDTTLEREMVWNGTHYNHEENLGYQTKFSYTITIVDGGNLQAEGGASEQIVGDGAPPRVLDAGIIDPGDGDLTIWAEVEEKGTGIDSLEVGYSVDEGQTWQQAPMQRLNATHYKAKVQVEPGSPIQWTIATKDLGGNANDASWDVWLVTPYITATKGIPLTYLVVIIAATGITAVIAIRRFRKVVGLDKERVMAIALNQMTDEDVIARLDDHTYGVILSFFDQREGPVPSIITPSLLEDHMQFLVDLSDRSFSAGGFVEETTEEKVTIFDLRLGESRMICISYGFAIDNPEARGGKENMTINLLVDPVYGELTNIFSPEILPSVRQIRSLVETKAPRLNISSHMDGLRSLVTRIIAAYQELYGEDAILEEGSVVTIEDA